MTEKRLYDSQRWRKLRKSFLSDQNHCMCVMCERIGRDVPATIADHREPHNGDPVKFWDINNLQGLCAMHHSKSKQQLEKTGRYSGCDENGMPLDLKHIWNKEK